MLYERKKAEVENLRFAIRAILYDSFLFNNIPLFILLSLLRPYVSALF